MKQIKAPRKLITAIYREGFAAGYSFDEINRAIEPFITLRDAQELWEHFCSVIKGTK